jgi:excisionase family DNA binding protein
MTLAAYTVPEVAAMLRIARSTAYRLIRAGQIPCVRVGDPGAPRRDGAAPRRRPAMSCPRLVIARNSRRLAGVYR